MNNTNNELPSVYLVEFGAVINAYNQHSDLIAWWGNIKPGRPSKQDKIVSINHFDYRPVWVDSVEQIKSAVDYQNKRG